MIEKAIPLDNLHHILVYQWTLFEDPYVHVFTGDF
jgi:hypothetical protein